MKDVWNAIRCAFAAIGGWIGWFVGGLDGFMYCLIIFVLADYITGVVAAAINHELSSEIGAKGIAKKLFEFLLVGIANVLDQKILQHGAAMRTVVIFFYVANEGLSIIENCTRIGLVVPKPLQKFLKKLEEDADEEEIDEEGNDKG